MAAVVVVVVMVRVVTKGCGDGWFALLFCRTHEVSQVLCGCPIPDKLGMQPSVRERRRRRAFKSPVPQITEINLQKKTLTTPSEQRWLSRCGNKAYIRCVCTGLSKGHCRLTEVLLYVHRNRRFIRDWSPGRPPRLSHSS